MSKKNLAVNILHMLNDGFKASFLLFLPFIAKDLSISLTKVGFLGTAMNALEILLAIPAATMAARVGGFRLLIITMLFYAVGYWLASIAHVYLVVIGAFLLAGISFAIFHPVAFSVVSQMFEKNIRGKQLGNFTAIGDLGRMGIASITTFVIAAVGWRFAAASSSLFIFVCFVLFFTAFSIHKKSQEHDESRHSEGGPSYKDLLNNKRFVFATAAFVIDQLASTALFVFIPFLLLKRGVSPALLGVLTSTFFIGNMFGKVVLGRLVDRIGNTNVFIFSELLMAVFIFVLASSSHIVLIVIAAIILGIFTKGTVPVLTTMITESVEHHGRYEKAFSLNAVFVGVGSSIAPLLLGYCSDRFGIVNAFYISALFAVLATVPALLFKRIEV